MLECPSHGPRISSVSGCFISSFSSYLRKLTHFISGFSAGQAIIKAKTFSPKGAAYDQGTCG